VIVHQFEIYLVALDPARGHEMQKTRPCVIVTPDSVNRHVQTVLVAPLTSNIRKYPFRPASNFGGKPGQVAIDQIRCVDHGRLHKKVGTLDAAAARAVLTNLVRMFS
jgi:mRNA interferase MazF